MIERPVSGALQPGRVSWIRVVVAPALLIIGACAILSTVLVARLIGQMERGLLDRAWTIAEVVARDAPLGIVGADPVALGRLALVGTSQRDVAYLRFVDRDGVVLFEHGAPRPVDTAFRPLSVQGSRVWATHDRWEMRVPVYLAEAVRAPEELSLGETSNDRGTDGNHERVGVVELGVDLGALLAERRVAISMAILFTTVVAAVAITAAVVVTRRHVMTLIAGAALAEERERVAALKSRIVTQTSHEFRTPLAVILSASQVLGRYHDRLSAADRDARLTRIQAAVGQMTGLLDDVLALGRSEAGHCKLVDVDLVALCDSVLSDVQMADGRERTIAVVRPSESLHLVCDPTLIAQAVRNLLTNALKYSPPETTVTFAIAATDDDVSLVVRDEGIGIPEDDLPHLFEPFQRAGNVGNRPGTGLGLAIARRGIRLHGGELSVDTCVGRGSTFMITLPRHSAGVDAGGDRTAAA